MKISATTWQTLSKLLDEALDMEPAARAEWLQQLTATQPEFAPSVRKLLAAHASSETADVMARLPVLELQRDRGRASALSTGDLVGPYRLKCELGAGGMADVWLAERADGAYTREVALKLPIVDRLRRDLAQRFARERTILARLEHPHIARLYDAGVTDDGLLYLAMEYVDGQPITDYCDKHKLPIDARLTLFLQVLEAVQYAHANLIIHRDLKPSNILVADGQVRLLDFGIAKLLADGDFEARETQLTQLSGRAFTPDYASPEQIKGEPLTIATDVYSLGVVFYELLVGRRPYRLKVKSVAQLEQAILEAEPVKLSSAVTATAAEQRSTMPHRLSRAVGGDLETITLKALAKLPPDRYSTIVAFSEDLQRERSGRPVLARPASLLYRAKKFAVRNKLAVGSASAIAVVLVAATATSVWQARVARNQTVVAQREAKRAETVQEFLLDLFRANSDRQSDPVKARTTTARELLDLGADRVATGLKDEPDARAAVLRTLAEMYDTMLLGDKAADLDAQRVALMISTHGPNDRRVAEALVALSSSLASTTRRSEIIPLLEQARSILDVNGDMSSQLRGELLTRLAQRHQSISWEKTRAYADEAVRILRAHKGNNEDRLSTPLLYAARARTSLGDFTGGESLMHDAIQELSRVAPVSNVALVQTLNSLGDVQAAQLKIEAAENTYRRGKLIAETKLGAEDATTLWNSSKLAVFLHSTGRREEARELHEAALRKILATRGEDDPIYTSGARIHFARSLLADGNFDRANNLAASAVVSTRKHYAGSEILGNEIRIQAAIATMIGRYDDARRLFAEGLQLAVQRETGGVHPSRLNRFFLDEARLDLASGDAQVAIDRLGGLILPASATQLPLLPDQVEGQLLLSQAHLLMGDASQALVVAQRALAHIQNSSVRSYYSALEAEALLRLGQAETALGNSGLACSNLERALELRAGMDQANSPRIAEVAIALAQCLILRKDLKTSAALMSRARAIHASNRELGEHWKRPVYDAERRLRAAARPS